MPVEYKQLKRRSRVKNPLRPPITTSKFHQGCYPPKSKSHQEIKNRHAPPDNLTDKKKYETVEDDVKLINKDAFDSVESFLKLKQSNLADTSDVDTYVRQILLNSGENNLKIPASSLSSSSSTQFHGQSNVVHKFYKPVDNNLDYQIQQLRKYTFNPVPKQSFYLNSKMTEEIKASGLGGLDPASTDPEEEEENDEVKQGEGEEEVNQSEEEAKDDEEGGEEEGKYAVDEQQKEKDIITALQEAGKQETDTRGAIDTDEENEEVIKITFRDPSEEEDEYTGEEMEDEYEDDDEEGEKSEAVLDVDSKPVTGFETYRIDAVITQEMSEASDKCAALQKEIEELQEEVKVLQNEGDLTDDKSTTLDRKRSKLMKKIQELESITEKIQEDLGFTGILGLKEQETPESKVDRWKAWEAVAQVDEFDFPQQSYPEDKLPRVIVCGHTEDRFPKIVVADSQKKPSANMKCLEDIAGRLSDSLNMQERLAKENELLEGGKFKLQEALLEKESTVENLQRKVGNLQSEMRMIVQENAKLSKQMARINEQVANQSYSNSYSGNSQRLSPRSVDNSGICSTFCASLKSKKGLNKNPPRLSGGGSGEKICLPPLSLNQNHNQTMSYRGPTLNSIPLSETSPSRSNCPAEIDNKLITYENNTKQLEQQLDTMESEVQHMKLELANTQRERQQIKQQNKHLKCTGSCSPCPCPKPMNLQSPSQLAQGALSPFAMGDSPKVLKQHPLTPRRTPSCTGLCTKAPMGTSNCPLQQLRDLREQYARLQEDYKNKLTEVSYLRTDADKMKQDVRDAKDIKEKTENRLIDLQERLKIFENERNRFNGSKEQIMEQEQTLIVTRQRYREAQDELEELRGLIQDQANQLEDYRNKYLQAQEQVEEQKRQIDLMEMDNARMNENVTLELCRVKNQFQEKLAELAPLPDILKQTQLKLQETQQMQVLAERNCEELARELLSCKDKIGTMTSQSELLRSENDILRGSNPDQLDDLQDKNRELRNENERIKNALTRLGEREAENKQRLEDKMHEIAQLASMLEQVREDSARQVSRTKERCETVRKSMQGQITEMEKQLVQCRAISKTAQRDRDEIRQKMQGQINHLNDAFDHAQGRIRSLQGHVNYLKTSYSNIILQSNFGDIQINDIPDSIPQETNYNAYNSCDCNF